MLQQNIIGDSNNPGTSNNYKRLISAFLKERLVSVSVRNSHLRSLAEDEEYKTFVFEKSSRSVGRRPGWHTETGIQARVQHAGFGGLIDKFDPLTKSDFDEQLLKGEEKMTSSSKFKGNRDLLFKATQIVHTMCKFPLRKFRPVGLQYAADTQLNHAASSGFPKFARKGNILDEIIYEAHLALDGKYNELFNYPCTRGYRIQIRETDGSLARKVRLMYPYPGAITLLETSLVMPFAKHFSNADTFYAIGRTGEQIGKRLKDVLSNEFSNEGTDVSAYDQNLCNEAIICAFHILRSQLELTQKENIIFNKLVDYFCTTIMVSKSGTSKPYLFIKDHGISSGSGFTNLIGTLAHAIVLCYSHPNILINEQCLICGDDVIFSSENVNLKLLIRSYFRNFNLTVDKAKSESFKDSSLVYFLGFKFINFERFISYKLAINQCIYHTDFRTDMDVFDREVSRCASIILNGKNGKSLFLKLFPDVARLLRLGQDIRYKYIPGFAPPTAKISRTSGISYERISRNHSLQLHLNSGYLIR